MQSHYVRYGRRYSVPSTAQILDELKTGFVPDYVPVSGGYQAPTSQDAKHQIDDVIASASAK